MTNPNQPLDPEVIKLAKDGALRAMNAIRFAKMGRPIAPVWPNCPRCDKLCTANELFTMAKHGVCSSCHAKEQP